MPILEAFHHQLPVLVSNNTCLPEVGGDAVLTFDPFDPQDIYQKMNMLIEDPALRENLIQKGSERLKLFSWELYADELIEIFRRSVDRN